jgi:hypothetical protein
MEEAHYAADSTRSVRRMRTAPVEATVGGVVQRDKSKEMRAALGSLLLLVACSGKPAEAPPPASPPPAPPAPAAAVPPDAGPELPPEATRVTAAALAEPAACGPFETADLVEKDQPLLKGRLRVRFVAKAVGSGGEDSDKLEASRDGVTLFVGAREMFQRGDATFARQAAKSATFGGTYDAVTLPGRDDKLSIVTGLLRDPPASPDLVALAHGWFLDKNQDVLDVAVFASGVEAGNLAACRRLAQQILATTAEGPRALTYGTGAEVTTKVSFASFTTDLPNDWLVTGWEGIHDFAHLRLMKRSTYPAAPVRLALGLDAHPGSWKSDGDETGTREGTLLGVPVTWHLTELDGVFGAWTVSAEAARRDRAVAQIGAPSAAERDAAIALAQSVGLDGRTVK